MVKINYLHFVKLEEIARIAKFTSHCIELLIENDNPDCPTINKDLISDMAQWIMNLDYIDNCAEKLKTELKLDQDFCNNIISKI